ncbi:MAG: transporter substrate-binding domain-containing protein [Alphaproteobacteria bacterium]|nr:transporter substrate-binding domain-containing protein [Alphaproteobacteria bacterium]
MIPRILPPPARLAAFGAALLVWTLAAFMPAKALAQNRSGPPAPTEEPWVIATGANYAPFVDPALPEGGLLAAIVRAAFAEATDRPIEVVTTSWGEAWSSTLEQGFAAAFPFAPTTARQEEMTFSAPILPAEIAVFRRADHTDPRMELGRLKLCLPLGIAPPTPLRSVVEEMKLRIARVATVEECALKVQRGQADVMLLPRLVRFGLDADRALAPLVAGDLPGERRFHHLVVPRYFYRGQVVIQAFNQGLARLKESGRLAEITRTHLGSVLAQR